MQNKIGASTPPTSAQGSRLPEAVQADIIERLEDGQSISAIARAMDLSRDQVRTVKFAQFGLTLNQFRRWKRDGVLP